MTRVPRVSKRWRLAVGVLVGSLMLAPAVLASEGGGDWRGTYDTVMKWVNFAILAFIFIKFVKTPLIDFLNLRKEQTARDIGRLEEQKKLAELKVRETQELIEKGEAHIARIKQRIIEQGEQEKARIIREARQQGRYMLEDAKARAQNQLVQAERSFKEELIEAAVTLAATQLPAVMTDDDHRVLVDRYLADDNLA